MKRRTRRSIRDAALLLMLLVLAATVRITPPPPGTTDLVPPAQAAQRAGLELPALQWTPSPEQPAEAAHVEHAEHAVDCDGSDSGATVDVRATVETEIDGSIITIRSGSVERRELRTLRLDTPICRDALRTILLPDDEQDSGSRDGGRVIRVRAALAADRDSGCS